MTTLTSKGQATIPKKIRDAMGLVPGDRIDFHVTAQGVMLMKDNDMKNKIATVRGKQRSALSTEELMALTRSED